MSRARLLILQILVAVVLVAIWHVGSTVKVPAGVLSAKAFYPLDPFFFSTPFAVFERTWRDFATGVIWYHLGITLLETLLAFFIGATGGVLIGFWFARQQRVAAVFDPYVKMANALPRVVLAPIFALWLGLGIWSKVALGVTLVFFIVFFNVYQGVKEVSPTVLANARMLGMERAAIDAPRLLAVRALLDVFPRSTPAVGFALVGAVVGEYLGSAAGLGYRIHQAEGVFDVTGVFSGMLVLAIFVIIIDTIVTAIENRLMVWRPTAATGQN